MIDQPRDPESGQFEEDTLRTRLINKYQRLKEYLFA